MRLQGCFPSYLGGESDTLVSFANNAEFDEEYTGTCPESLLKPKRIPSDPGPEKINHLRQRPTRLSRFLSQGLKGGVLVVTDNLDLVFDLRRDLLQHEYHLTWTNNFWVATSYLQTDSFSALVLDLDLETLEKRYVYEFLESYEENSHGKEILLSHSMTKWQLTFRDIQSQAQLIETPENPQILLKALQLDIPE